MDEKQGRVAGATGPLVLRQRGRALEILAGNVVLLSSAALETELAFGRLATSLGGPRALRVLVGGLGFGATVEGVLEGASPETRVVVAEKVAQVVALSRRARSSVVLADSLPRLVAESALTFRPLDDPRVSVVEEDVFEVMARSTACWDCILLDVDNGPHWASFRTNARLYSPGGLAAALRALTVGGFLAVWSGYPADAFLPRLREAGFAPSRVLLHEHGRVRARAYVGTRESGGAADRP